MLNGGVRTTGQSGVGGRVITAQGDVAVPSAAGARDSAAAR